MTKYITKIILLTIFQFINILHAESPIDIKFEYAGEESNNHYIVMKIKTPEGLKTYWRNAGFGGISPKFNISSKSRNILKYDLLWGTPKYSYESGILNYVLPKTADIIIEIKPKKKNRNILLSGNLTYGYCDVQCKVGNKSFHLNIDMKEKSSISPDQLMDIKEKKPQKSDSNEIVIKDLYGKIDEKNHIISFDILGIDNISEDDIFYVLDTEYEVKKPFLQKRADKHFTFTVDLEDLYKIPSKIEIIIDRKEKRPLAFHKDIKFDKNIQ